MAGARMFHSAAEPNGWAWEYADGSYHTELLSNAPPHLSGMSVIVLFATPEDAETWAEHEAILEGGRPVIFYAK